MEMREDVYLHLEEAVEVQALFGRVPAPIRSVPGALQLLLRPRVTAVGEEQLRRMGRLTSLD